MNSSFCRRGFYLLNVLLVIFGIGTSSAGDIKTSSISPKPIIIFRLDDVVLFENKGEDLAHDMNFLNGLIEEFTKRKIPLTLAVIPYWKNREVEVDSSLIKQFSQQIKEGLIEVAQHGFRHRSGSGDQTEFRSIPYSIQEQSIQKGRGILEKAFSSKITTFVPPWNNYDRTTVQILINLKFNALSGDLGPVGRLHKNPIEINENKISYIPATCSFREVNHAVKLSISAKYRPKRGQNFIVVCFHPYNFASSAKDPISNIELIKVLDELKHLPVAFATLKDVANSYSDELHLSRQVRAARVENLGKAIKLLPGFQILLPGDYHFGRWIPFGVYLSEEVYSSIEKRILVTISLFSLVAWILFVEVSRLAFRKRIHVWNMAIWIFMGSIFSLSAGLYFLFLPERISLSLAGIWSSGICLLYWISRMLFFWFFSSNNSAKRDLCNR